MHMVYFLAWSFVISFVHDWEKECVASLLVYFKLIVPGMVGKVFRDGCGGPTSRLS